MMFMIRQGDRTVVVGPDDPRHCPKCDEVKAFRPELTYSYGEFDLLFGFAYGKRYRLICPTCQHGWVLDARTVEKHIGLVPIPFRLRFGPLIFIGVVAALAWAVQAYRQSVQ